MATCFVIMGFDKKVDHRTKRTLDLDKTYRIIKAAVKDAGVECVRADEIMHSGVIDKPMYEQLLEADVVIADLSTSNENAIYELGVRHALRPNTTIVIAEKQFSFPFDLAHVVIRTYEHLGTGIDFEEAERLKGELTAAVRELVAQTDVDSPVYTFIPGLRPPTTGPGEASAAAEVRAAASRADAVEQEEEQSAEASPAYGALMQAFLDARGREDFVSAKALLESLLAAARPQSEKERAAHRDDPYLLQQHALATYKSKTPDERTALEEARATLSKLEPESSSDPETLGLWGAVHKRLWDATQDASQLDTAIRAYERGFFVKLDYYNGINYAFLLDQRAALQQDDRERVTDHVLARRTRLAVLGLVDEGLRALPRADESTHEDPAEAYWLEATGLEALYGLNRMDEFKEASERIYASAPESWMPGTTRQQIGRLATLLGHDAPTVAGD